MSERVRAFEMAFQAAERSRTGAPAPFALCPACRAPLISTLAFPGSEFYCLDCGRQWGFTQPEAGEPTPELQARYDTLKAEWDAHAGAKLLIRGWYDWCPKCRAGGEYHTDHATDEERAEHEAAIAWLTKRSCPPQESP